MFRNPYLLIGLSAAVIPLILHLLSRSRYRDVDWAAMMFLQDVDSHRRQSGRLTQIVLLLLRTAIIALLAVTLARPVVRARWAGQESENRVTAALLLDCSGSMSFEENGRTRFQMAQAAARQIIRGLRPGDRIALIMMGAPAAASELEPTGDLRAIEARIDDAKPASGTASLRESLDMAAEVLSRYEKSSRDVFVVCDRQASSWRELDESFGREWRQRMRGPRLNTRMFVLPVGSNEADNLAVDSVRLVSTPAIVGQPTEVEVLVHNYGPVQHAAVPVSIEGPSLSVPERSVSLGPNQSLGVTFSVTFGQSGSQVVSARVRSVGYTGDDQLDLAVNVIDPIRVLVVSGDEQQGQYRSESDFLRWALQPRRSSGLDGGDPCAVTVAPAEKWSDADLPKYQVVVLANVERFTRQQAQALEKYVYSGGRLLIAPGSLSRPENYNEMLYRDGAGILPAMLDTPTAADGSEATSLLGLQTDHPVFRFLRGRFEIPSATIARYFPATPRQVDANVLARYLSSDPFLIEGRRGQVLLVTTALDADWSTLPLSNFYLPFVQSAVKFLAGGATVDGNLSPGDSIRLLFDDPATNRTVTLTRPDGRSVNLDVVRLDKQSEVRYSDTSAPGTYKLQVQESGKPPQVSWFVVPTPRTESDLTQLTDERWQTLEKSLGFSRVDPMSRAVPETLSGNREGWELWGELLVALLALIVLEMYYGKRAGAGHLDPAQPESLLEPGIATV